MKKITMMFSLLAAGAMGSACAEVSDDMLATVDQLEAQGHEVTWVQAPAEEAVPQGPGAWVEAPAEESVPQGSGMCPNGWADTSQVAIKCGVPTVLVTKDFQGVECATCKEPKCGGPWASILTPIACLPGYELKLNHNGTCQRCVKADVNNCLVGGCNSELCYDPDSGNGISICVWKPEYICYQSANCGPYGPGGDCEWEETSELLACLEDNSVNP